MPPRPWLVRVEDILDAAVAIGSYVRGLDEETFRQDRRTVDAVVRNLEVIGEAARYVPETARLTYPEIPWLEMADMRNVLSHEYFGVDLTIVWKTVHEDLPAIEPLLVTLVERERSNG